MEMSAENCNLKRSLSNDFLASKLVARSQSSYSMMKNTPWYTTREDSAWMTENYYGKDNTFLMLEDIDCTDGTLVIR